MQGWVRKGCEVSGHIRLLIAELHHLLTPTDPRWSRLGSNLPGAKERPATPEGIVITAIDETFSEVTWKIIGGCKLRSLLLQLSHLREPK